MNQKQRLVLRKFINELSQIKGRHTELVSVYIPAGYDLNKIISHLQQEQGTATNIKDAHTRKNVIDSLEKAIRHLRIYKKTPENGLAVFAGNASDVESKIDLKVWSIEPPEPIATRFYRCDQFFLLDLLQDMLEVKEVYGLIVLDRREANVGLLKGKNITSLFHLTSGVPGKTRAGGQCLVPSTLIQSVDGDVFEIGESHNPNVLVGSLIENFSIKNAQIIDKWYSKKNLIYKIITKSPRLEIECSKDHVFFVREEGVIEKPAKELKEGDFLIMPEKITVEGKKIYFSPAKYYNAYELTKKGRALLKKYRINKKLYQKELAKSIGVTQTAISTIELGKRSVRANLLSELCEKLQINFGEFIIDYTTSNHNINLPNCLDNNLAQIIGYFLGDGNFEKERLDFSEQTKEIAEYYERLFRRYFNANTNLRFRKNKGYWQIRVYGKPLVKFIKQEFPEIKSARQSSIPKKILESNNKIVACFLKGFFDAEAYVNLSRGLSLGLNNKKIIQQLQMVLLRFGILASVYDYDNRKNPYSKNYRFIIDVTEKLSLELFRRHIGFTSKKKSEKLAQVIKNKSNVSYVRQIVVSGKRIRNIVENAGYSLTLFPKVNNFFRDERMISKQAFYNSILKVVKKKDQELYKKLRELYNYPILPVKIARIEKRMFRINMVDISTKLGNFIANGLIVHNSAARFSRIREEEAKAFYNRIGGVANKAFLEMQNLKGVIIGGPGPSKEEFFDGNYLNNEVKKKFIGMKDLSYTGDFGLQELVEKSHDLLAKEEIIREKQILQKFFEMLAREPKKVVYGKAKVKKALEMGAVDVLLISEVLGDREIEEFEKTANNFGSQLQIISVETMEGIQLKELGGIAAILRYAIE